MKSNNRHHHQGSHSASRKRSHSSNSLHQLLSNKKGMFDNQSKKNIKLERTLHHKSQTSAKKTNGVQDPKAPWSLWRKSLSKSSRSNPMRDGNLLKATSSKGSHRNPKNQQGPLSNMDSESWPRSETSLIATTAIQILGAKYMGRHQQFARIS